MVHGLPTGCNAPWKPPKRICLRAPYIKSLETRRRPRTKPSHDRQRFHQSQSQGLAHGRAGQPFSSALASFQQTQPGHKGNWTQTQISSGARCSIAGLLTKPVRFFAALQGGPKKYKTQRARCTKRCALVKLGLTRLLQSQGPRRSGRR